MIPSGRWFPFSLAERAVWFDNFTNNFSTLAVGLGFTPADVAAVAADNNAFQYLATTAVTIDAFSKGMTAYRKEIFEGNNGSPAATIPATPDLGTAVTALPGIFERLDDLVKRIRVAPSYSAEEGEQLGIVPGTIEKTSLNDQQPTFKAAPKPGRIVEVTFVRGQSDGLYVEMRLDDTGDWVLADKLQKSPGEFIVAANPGNLPRSVQLRARYLENNKPIGLYSDTVNLTTMS